MRIMSKVVAIEGIESIPDADKICVYQVGGWRVVDRIDSYNVGDLAVYCEIDSWIPTTVAPFLSGNNYPKMYEGICGERLRTKKLRGVISQGLLLPISIIPDTIKSSKAFWSNPIGFDVSGILGITKYEAPIPAQLAGDVLGMFPSLVPKTDEERIQNLGLDLHKWKNNPKNSWEVSVKLDGSSCTMYLDKDGEFHVCSRNLDLKKDVNNTFWKVAIDLNVEAKMRDCQLFGYAIQGELIGNGIQGNPYKITGHDFYVFKIYDVNNGNFLLPTTRRMITEELGLKHVPIMNTEYQLTPETTIDQLLKLAEQKSVLNPKAEEEGFVYKSNNGPESFKTISNKFLLKSGE